MMETPISNINNILKSYSVGEAKAGSAKVNTWTLSGKDEIIDVIHKFGRCVGWVTLTDEVLDILSPRVIDVAELKGRMPLSAELSDGRRSIHLRQSPAGWLVAEIEALDSGNMIVFEEMFVNRKKDAPELCYEIYWRLQPDAMGVQAYQPWLSRFAGFKKGEDDD